MKLTANVRRGERWWVISVPEIEGLHTQARRLDQVEAMVLDAAALLTDRPESDFEVTVSVALDRDTAVLLERQADLAEAARLLQADASTLSRDVAHRLAARGLGVRDVGTILGISYQRASQLLAEPAPERSEAVQGIESHDNFLTISVDPADQRWQDALAQIGQLKEWNDAARDVGLGFKIASGHNPLYPVFKHLGGAKVVRANDA